MRFFIQLHNFASCGANPLEEFASEANLRVSQWRSYAKASVSTIAISGV
jgi:hypothetical protein